MRSLVLGDSLTDLIDYRGKTPKKLGADFTESGIPVASAMLVDNGVLDLSAARFVSEDTHAAWMTSRTRKGDVILTSEAPLGRVARVPSDDPLVLGQRLFCLRGKPNVLDNGYLYYALQTAKVQADLIGRSSGTTVFGIRQSALREVAVPAPEFKTQQAIAEVLGALDDKIAANTQLSSTVDQFLGALFARVTDNTSTIRLGEIATVNPGTHKPVSGGSIRYIDISSVGQGTFEFPDISQWDDAPSRARRHVQSGDTLWSTVRPNRRSHALNLSDDKLLVGSTGLAILRPREVGYAYLYEATKTPAFTAYLENVAEGSAYPAVRANRFDDAPISWAAAPERNSFETTAAPLRRTQHSLDRQSLRLASVRDALLPQFMSGKLRVKQAEEFLSAVV